MVPNPRARKSQLVVHGETDDNQMRRESSTSFEVLNSRPEHHQFLKATDVNLCTQVVPESVHSVIREENVNMVPQRSRKNGLHQTESSLLPLERIPEGAKTQNILATLRSNLADLPGYMSMLAKHSNHLQWLTLPDSPSSGFLPRPKEEELKHW
jgi:hypothetical protein